MRQITIKSYETKSSIVTPIIFLIIGILLLVNPGGIVEFISYIFGGVFLALGICKIIVDSKRVDKTSGDTFYSVLMIVIGIIFIAFSGTIEFIIRLAIGIWILVNALKSIIIGANSMNTTNKNIVSFVIGFILLIIGLYTIFVSNLMLQSLGLVIIIYAVFEIVDYINNWIRNR